jgi:hypothetical protein
MMTSPPINRARRNTFPGTTAVGGRPVGVGLTWRGGGVGVGGGSVLGGRPPPGVMTMCEILRNASDWTTSL